MKQFYVKQNEAGQRLDKLLAKILNKAPKSFIYKMLRKKNITLNGRKAEGAEKLELNDEIKLFLSDETFLKFSEAVVVQNVETTAVELKKAIIYEDQHIMILNKPVGVLSQKSEKNDISMVEYVISYLMDSGQLTQEQLTSFKPAVCNRLDRNTSGILIAGKSLPGLQNMAGLLKDRSLNKYYLCIVKGRVEGQKRVEGYLSKNEEINQVKINPGKGENSEYICTEYQPLAYSVPSVEVTEDFSLLQVKLITGRSHQIRAHLASIGHPIIGDYKYGDRKTNQFFTKRYDLKHQLLHSYRCVFPMLEGVFSYLSGREYVAEVPDIFQSIRYDLFDREL